MADIDLTILNVKVQSPEKVFFEGEATAITSLNTKGPFDILAQHENFISLFKDKLTIHKKDGQKEDLDIKVGVLRVVENKVTIFLGLEFSDASSLARGKAVVTS